MKAKKNIVKINGKEYKVKSTLRALFIFEQITGRPFEIRNSLDNFLFLYSVILANNPEEPLTWETFIDALDEDPKIVDRINEILKENGDVEKLISKDLSNEEGEKKN